MEYVFEYSGAMERCKMLSSFEGREYTGGSGESLYLTVRLTEQDEPLLLVYMEQAAREIEKRVVKMVRDAEYTDKGFTWDLRTDETRWNANTKLERDVTEALVSYAMMRWLAERKPARTDAYRELWEGILKKCSDDILRKGKPLL